LISLEKAQSIEVPEQLKNAIVAAMDLKPERHHFTKLITHNLCA